MLTTRTPNTTALRNPLVPTRSAFSATAKRIVSRLQAMNGEARTYPLQTALAIPETAFEAAVSELVAAGCLVRVRGFGARLILA